MFDVIYTIVLFSVLFLGFVWLMYEIIQNYKLCKDKREELDKTDLEDDYFEN